MRANWTSVRVGVLVGRRAGGRVDLRWQLAPASVEYVFLASQHESCIALLELAPFAHLYASREEHVYRAHHGFLNFGAEHADRMITQP